MGPLVFFLFALVAAIVVCILGFLSIRNLLQAWTLRRPVPLARLKNHVDKVVAVRGRPELLKEERSPFKFPVLWYRRKYQEWRSSGRGGGRWCTLDSKEKAFDFTLHFPDGGRMVITARPTEVRGASSRIRRRGLTARTRTVQEWVPLRTDLTVMGRLRLSKRGASFVPDRNVGLFFSTAPPERAAFWEFVKGFGGIAACIAIVVGLILFWVSIS